MGFAETARTAGSAEATSHQHHDENTRGVDERVGRTDAEQEALRPLRN